MQSRNDKSLETSFKKVIKIWLKSVKNFQILNPSAVHSIEIFENMKSLDKKYNAILTWSAEKEDRDLFSLFKSRFLELHRKEFQFMLRKQAESQQELLKIMAEQERQYQIECEEHQREVSRIIESHKKYYQQLESAAQELIALDFNSQVAELTYQSSVTHLQASAKKIMRLDSIPPLPFIKMHDSPRSRDVLEVNKTKMLHHLDQNILACESTFNKEKWWQKVLSFFSPTRRRELAVIQAYKENVQSISGIHRKYTCAVEWMKKSSMDKSILAANCILPFQKAVKQIGFETLPFYYNQSQKEIEQALEVQKHSYQSQKEKMNLLTEELKSIHTQSQDLHKLLEETANKIGNIKEAGVFGFTRNHAALVEKNIKRIVNFIDSKDPALRTASEIIQQVALINPNTPIEKMRPLADKAASIKQSPKAMNAIQEVVEKVIEDTVCYGGKANNYQFMGATQAARVVNLLGTENQKNSFRKIKQASDQRTKQSNLHLEQECVDNLLRGIETQTLSDKLKLWRDAMLRHRKVNGRTPTVNSEQIYQHEVRFAARDAALFHQLGQKTLENFITSAMHAALNVSQYDLKNKFQLSGVETLHWEEIDTLVSVYGTKVQSHRWNHDVLPRLSAPKLYRSFH